MIVQATNTGGDLSEGQFDLAIPGGGVGLCEFLIHQSFNPTSNLLMSSQWLYRRMGCSIIRLGCSIRRRF